MAIVSASKFHQIPEAVWERLEPLLPKYERSPKGGKPRLPLRQVANGIFYVLVTGCQWKAMPREFGSGSAIHAYFQEWVGLGIFQTLWSVALEEYDDLKGIDWEWQSMDGAMNKSPLGGEKKPGKTRQIVARSESNARCRSMAAAFPSGRRWLAPMCMIRGLSKTRSTVFLSHVPNRRDASASTYASIKATLANLCSNSCGGVITFRTCRLSTGNLRSRSIATAKLAVGRSNGRTLGLIEPEDY